MKKIYVAIVILVLLGLSLYLMEGYNEFLTDDEIGDMAGNFTTKKFFKSAQNAENLRSMNSIGIKGELLNDKAVFIPLNEKKFGNYDKIKHQCMDEENITKNEKTVGGLNKLCYICSSIRKEGDEMNKKNDLTQNICDIVVDKKTVVEAQGDKLTEDDKDMYCNCCGYNDPICKDSLFIVDGDDDEFTFDDDS